LRITIERMRTLVLVAGALLVAALVAFLAIGKLKNPFNYKEIPGKLGINIQQEANGVTYTQAHGGHTVFKLHASKVVQLKQGNALLHDVKIDLYAADGTPTDRIEGGEFEYDQSKGTAVAAGPVEITLMRPGVAPAIAPKASAGKALGSKDKPLASAAQTAERGEIHVKTSGLTFDQKSGIATTDKHVDFSLTQGAGSSLGATYDSQKGLLVLEHAVVLNTRRGNDPVELQAQHAEFQRAALTCRLRAAMASFQGGKAASGDATILFRQDGSAVRLNAVSGFTLETESGSHLASPAGVLEFDEHDQPRHGHLEGGVTMDSTSQTVDRRLHGTAPTVDLDFTAKGELRHAHLERGVEFHSEEHTVSTNLPMRTVRNWLSPLADVEFRDAGHGQVEPSSIHGTGGVVVTGESQRGKEPVVPSRLAADDLTGQFGPGSILTAMNGVGHAGIEETTVKGTRQTTSGERLEAHFEVPAKAEAKGAAKADAKTTSASGVAGAAQVQSAIVEGHVVLLQVPSAKPGAPAAAPMRASAGRAVYEGEGEWLHLTLNPRVEDGGLQLTADKIDVSHISGDAFAHGNVKSTWTDTGSKSGKAPQGSVALGGQGPAHVISAEAQLHQATSEATFKGQARLWQQANSVAAPVIVLDRARQTLTARSSDVADPVRVVLLSAGSTAGKDGNKSSTGKTTQPSVIRVHGGDLKYSDVERKAVLHGIGSSGTVVAETGTATSVSNEVELILLPAGDRANKDAAAAVGGAQVDRLTARGKVVVSSQGRRGTGEQLVYTGATGEYVLTGTAATPPRMTDPVRGIVTGEALIFHGRDDSVSVEGGAKKTTTETSAPK